MELVNIKQISRKLKSLCLSLAVFLLAFVFVPYLASSANATTDATASVTWTPLELALSDGGNVAFTNLVPSSDGTMEVVKKTLTVSTTGKAYAVYLSMDSDSNRLHYNGDSASTLGIPAIGNGTSTGTWASPASFSGRGWGFAVPGVNNFAASSIYGNLSLNENIFSNDSGYNTGTWAAVPVLGSAQKIYSNTIPNNQTTDSFDIYYAIMADSDLIAGTYSNQLTYTALAATTSLDTVSNNLSVRNASTNTGRRIATNGDTLTLNFDLSQSTSGLITRNKTKVYLVPHSTVASANYALTDSIKNNKSSYPACTINSSNTDFVITNDASSGATINCTIGASSNGTLPGVEGNNNGAGSYDVWVNIEDYDINYFSKYLTSDKTATLPSIVFAGLQSHDSSGYIVTKMQEMTSSICKNTNEWNNQTGSSARIYDYRGLSGNNPLLAAGVDTNGISSFLLEDTRDSKTYKVRRLADGNCWMVQNLDLDLTSVGTLTANDTDLNSKTSWTPDVATITSSFTDATTARTRDNGWRYIDGGVFVDTNYDETHASHYVGDYYNWYAAVAESATYDTVGYAEDSICAKGWRIPRDAGQYSGLASAHSISSGSAGTLSEFMSLPLNFELTGTVDTDNSVKYQESAGLFWTAYSGVSRYVPSLDYNASRPSDVNFGMNDNKTRGKPIRCVAR